MADVNKVCGKVTLGDDVTDLIFEDTDEDGKVDLNELKVKNIFVADSDYYNAILKQELNKYGISRFDQIVGKSAYEFMGYLCNMNRALNSSMRGNNFAEAMYRTALDSAKTCAERLGLDRSLPDKAIDARLGEMYARKIVDLNEALNKMQISYFMAKSDVEVLNEEINGLKETIDHIAKLLGKTKDDVEADIKAWHKAIYNGGTHLEKVKK